jgi:hypothetical protein
MWSFGCHLKNSCGFSFNGLAARFCEAPYWIQIGKKLVSSVEIRACGRSRRLCPTVHFCVNQILIEIIKFAIGAGRSFCNEPDSSRLRVSFQAGKRASCEGAKARRKPENIRERSSVPFIETSFLTLFSGFLLD